MRAAGTHSIADIDELSVMGLSEVVRAYPRLRRLRNALHDRFVSSQLDLLVGVDVPDFNLGLERSLKRRGIRTAHVVCPQVWAWREGRARQFQQCCDRLLALLPFEPDFLAKYAVRADFIGHPLADDIPLEPNREMARRVLGLDTARPVIGLLPGSRGQERRLLAPQFAAAARLLLLRYPHAVFVCAAVNQATINELREVFTELPVHYVERDSGLALSACDVALLASGTVSLEAMLCKTPMVVAYRMSSLSYHIIRHMINIPNVALPNILATETLVPELIQHEANAPALADAVATWLEQPQRQSHFVARATTIHRELRQDAGQRAAAILTAMLTPAAAHAE